MYIVFAVCILLLLSLLNSWSSETELRNKIYEISTQLQECSKQQSTCMEESLTMLEQRDGYVSKVNELDKLKGKLTEDLSDAKHKLKSIESKVNRTLVDVEICKTELQSLKNLQESKSGTLETLRFEKETLTSQLTEKKEKIEELEKEIEKLKLSLTMKSVNPPVPSKVTSAVQPPKQSPALNAPHQINEPILDNNDAKEVEEEANLLSDGNDYDPKLQ